jgi:hypothetical protein
VGWARTGRREPTTVAPGDAHLHGPDAPGAGKPGPRPHAPVSCCYPNRARPRRRSWIVVHTPMCTTIHANATRPADAPLLAVSVNSAPADRETGLRAGTRWIAMGGTRRRLRRGGREAWEGRSEGGRNQSAGGTGSAAEVEGRAEAGQGTRARHVGVSSANGHLDRIRERQLPSGRLGGFSCASIGRGSGARAGRPPRVLPTDRFSSAGRPARGSTAAPRDQPPRPPRDHPGRPTVTPTRRPVTTASHHPRARAAARTTARAYSGALIPCIYLCARSR